MLWCSLTQTMMRRALEANMETGTSLKTTELPARSFREWRNAEFTAESLAEVASQKEESAQADDTTQADFVREGSRAVLRVDRATEAQVPAARGTLGHGVPALPEEVLGSRIRRVNAQVSCGLVAG